MVNKRSGKPSKISIWSEKDVLQVLSRRHAGKLWYFLINHPEITSIENIPFEKWSVSVAHMEFLKQNFVLYTTSVVHSAESRKGDTIKLVIELFDGHRIETVIMKHHKRTTVCLSSQVGCQMGCRFCATGTMGIIGDLTSDEIIEQLVRSNHISKVRNIVFMGMGEPLNNYENVKSAFDFMIDPERFGLCTC